MSMPPPISQANNNRAASASGLMPAFRIAETWVVKPSAAIAIAKIMVSKTVTALHQWEHPMQLGSTEAIKQVAAEGLGLTCLSLCAVQGLLTLKRLVLVGSTLPRLTRRFYLIQHRQKQFSGSLEKFVAHCESESIQP